MQRYCFFPKLPNNQPKKCIFLAKKHQNCRLFLFCYFHFAKSTSFLPIFLPSSFSCNSTIFSHLYTFSTTPFSPLKTPYSILNKYLFCGLYVSVSILNISEASAISRTTPSLYKISIASPFSEYVFDVEICSTKK